MAARVRKRSASITLVLIGAAALAGCGQDQESGKRPQYATREACLADWGDPKDCEEVTQNTSTSRSHGSYWYGPSHSSGRSSRSSSGSSTDASSSSSSGHSSGSVSRGGFGSSGHSHSSSS